MNSEEADCELGSESSPSSATQLAAAKSLAELRRERQRVALAAVAAADQIATESWSASAVAPRVEDTANASEQQPRAQVLAPQMEKEKQLMVSQLRLELDTEQRDQAEQHTEAAVPLDHDTIPPVPTPLKKSLYPTTHSSYSHHPIQRPLTLVGWNSRR